MTNTTSPRALAGIGLATVSLLALAACGSSSNTPSATATSPSATASKPAVSLGQRVAVAKVCLQVGKDIESAAPLLAEVTSKRVTPAQAMTQLQPTATKIDALAKANASLPIGPALTTLSTDIAAAQKSNTASAAAVQATIKKLSTDATAVLTACAK